MTSKQLIRAYQTSKRRSERATAQRQRHLQANLKAYEKSQALEMAQDEVELYQAVLDNITSIHKQEVEAINWQEVIAVALPEQPQPASTNEHEASRLLAQYKPSFFHKLTGKDKKLQQQLASAVESARAKDQEGYSSMIKEHEIELKEIEEMKSLAKRVTAGELSAYPEVLSKLNPFSDIAELGSSLDFATNSLEFMEVTLKVKSDSVIPSEEKALTKAGKVTSKKIADSKSNQLYQDYVCGAAIRIAREIFAILPVQTVFVHAIGELLDSSTGKMEECCVLSVVMPRENLERLNIEAIDCSDSMKNFVHNMKFTKTGGFGPVDRIDRSKYLTN